MSSTTDPVPAELAVVAGPVESRLRSILDAERTRWSDIDPTLAEPFEVLESFVLRGGKRLRPAFCHWAFIGAGGEAGDPRVVDAGAAFELLHAFALVHDDVTARMSREHNDANVMALGARIVPADTARALLKTFFETPFEGGRHARRVEKLG